MAVRARSDGFLVAEDTNGGMKQYKISLSGTVTDMGTYPDLPTGYSRAYADVLDASGNLYTPAYGSAGTTPSSGAA